MARGDPTYCKIDVDVICHGERLNALRPEHRYAYLCLWALAVKFRTDTLDARRMPPSFLASTAHLTRQLLFSSLKEMSEHGLIEILPDKSIFVRGVRDCHPKLSWDKCPIRGQNGESNLPQPVPILSTFREYESKRDLSTDPDTEIVTPSRTPPPPGPSTLGAVLRTVPGAVDKYSYSGKSTGTRAGSKPDDPEPDPIERWTEAWFLDLWPHGEYDWNAEKDSLLSLVRKYGRGPYAYAQAILIEHRKEHKRFDHGELAYLNGIAREQAKKTGKPK